MQSWCFFHHRRYPGSDSYPQNSLGKLGDGESLWLGVGKWPRLCREKLDPRSQGEWGGEQFPGTKGCKVHGKDHLPGGFVVKNWPANAGDAEDTGLIPGLGRSPAEGHVNPLQYSRLKIFMERGAWPAAAHGVTESRTHWVTKGLHALIAMYARNLIKIKVFCKSLTLHKYAALSFTT